MQYGTKVSIATNNYKLLQVIINYFGVVIADKNHTSLPYSICQVWGPAASRGAVQFGQVGPVAQ